MALTTIQDLRNHLQWAIQVELTTVPTYLYAMYSIKNQASESANVGLKQLFRTFHSVRMLHWHAQHEDDPEEALANAELRYRYDPDTPSANNIGYLYLAQRDLEKAGEWLEKAGGGNDNPLATYNLGVLKAMQGEYENALGNFHRAAESESLEVVCLLQLKIGKDSQTLEFEEILNPNLQETAWSAIAAVESVLGNNK